MKKIIKLCFLGLFLTNFAVSDTIEALPAPHQAPIVGSDISLDGKTLATASFDGTVRLWDIKTGALRKILFPENLGKGKMVRVKFDPKNRWISIIGIVSTSPLNNKSNLSQIYSLYIYSLDGENLINSIEDIGEFPTALCVSPDGKYLNTAYLFKGIEIRNTGDWSIVSSSNIDNQNSQVLSCEYDKNNNLITIDEAKFIRIYDLNGTVLYEEMIGKVLSDYMAVDEQNFYFLHYNSETDDLKILKKSMRNYLSTEILSFPYVLKIETLENAKILVYKPDVKIFYILVKNGEKYYLYKIGMQKVEKCHLPIQNKDTNLTNAFIHNDELILIGGVHKKEGIWSRISLENLNCQ